MTWMTEHHDTGDGLVQLAATGGGAFYRESGVLQVARYGPWNRSPMALRRNSVRQRRR